MVNKTHPDYHKYVEECNSLRDKYDVEFQKIEKVYGEIRGKDGGFSILTNQFVLNFKMIQEKYSYLFD